MYLPASLGSDVHGVGQMENLDRFFEAYDRLLPRYFSEVVAAMFVVGGIMIWAL